VQVKLTPASVALTASALAGAVAVGVACIADLPANAVDAAIPGCGDGYIDLALGEECDPGPLAGDAGVLGCTSGCRVKCPSGLIWKKNNHCYALAANATSFDPEAETRCSDLGGHVVTFASEEEFGAAAGFMQTVDAGALWVGLVQVQGQVERQYNSVAPFEPGWSPDCSGCFAHAADPSAPLPRVIAASDDGGPPPAQPCVLAESDTARYPSWRQSVCVAAPSVHTMCEREPVGRQWIACDAGAGVVCIDLVATRNAERYLLLPPMTADGARQACESLGGRLVVLQSRDEREQLWHQLSLLPAPPAKFWIGLSQATDAGDGAAPWVWDDGTRVDAPDAHPSPWGRAEPILDGLTSTAYLALYQAQPDDTLARNSEREVTLPAVCELAVVQDGGR